MNTASKRPRANFSGPFLFLRKGDVEAIVPLANRIEGRPPQAVSVDATGLEWLAERISEARHRVMHGLSEEDIEEKIAQLEAELRFRRNPDQKNYRKLGLMS